MVRLSIGVALLVSACSDGASGGDVADAAMSGARAVVVNELLPHGGSDDDPDWAELKNTTGSTIDLSGYSVRDKDLGHLVALPGGTSIPAGGYVVIYCDDQPDGGATTVLHVPWKLSSKEGDEFHLLDRQGTEVDQATFGADEVPGKKSWGRLPDGTGAFVATTPTMGAANL
jgi:hypothetical protein